jgi:type II restriction/modification system DNA methylase subunit YeeA
MRHTRELEKEIQKEISALEYKYGLPVVSGAISDIQIKYAENNEKLGQYLHDVREHILSNLKTFKEKKELAKNYKEEKTDESEEQKGE